VLADHDPLVVADAGVELPVPHVDGPDLGRAVLQETVGEPAGGGTGVETAATGNVEAELLEGRLELGTAPADVPGRRAEHHDRLVGGDEPGGLVGRGPADRDPALGDQLLRLAPRRDQATPDQFEIETTTR
jgi:hypothetical protein